MTPALRVVTPGLLTTVQDLGRHGYQHLGIPVCGALDPVSLRAANVVAGNAAGAAALEVAYLGPTLAVDADEVRMAVVGAEAAIDILDDAAASSGRRVENMRSFTARRGEIVRIGALMDGAVLYVAVEGGFDIAPELGSVATCMRGSFGGWHGRPLIAGDMLPLCRMQASEREEVRLEGLDLAAPARFRALPGPQTDHFSERDIAVFFEGEYTVGAGSDRMGMRLSGPPIGHRRGFDIVSDGIAPGSIQIPGNGQPIVLLADHQTTGGYPKIATVISADLPALSRRAVGTRVAFEAVTLEQAEAARRAFVAEIGALREKLVPIPPRSADSIPTLFACNLISGVIDAAA